MNQIFVDTSGWANLFIATESYHNQAKQWFLQSRQQNDQLITSNYVISEILRQAEAHYNSINDELISLTFPWKEESFFRGTAAFL
ncbi:MAG: type II toxin-antitoxin system VapC family toxin [Cylindrospermopsis raciborskii KL1]|uniref:type II toxin-antitoxin system VapC family toxin n=1 Tax=Cylindrospermopsis raciborskii TaxID=77022 RepID=UPI001A1CBBC2|nr:type II toxin-antitoxin system VapC family toxin [Cylindrospermopsis raciborskii]MBG0744845.1 type II toxin-antitoxin system VapC family toxin [Cylindrospermopsis raciborskii KL1]